MIQPLMTDRKVLLKMPCNYENILGRLRGKPRGLAALIVSARGPPGINV